MNLPSFSPHFVDGERRTPRLVILEVRPVRAAPSDSPKLFVLVERVEKTIRNSDGSVYSVSLDLVYRVLEPGHRQGAHFSSRWHGIYDVGRGAVSLTGGSIFLEPDSLRGMRVGTYLMNEIVGFAKRWPRADVRLIELLDLQAQEDNKERRNRFYERFGLVFDYGDSTRVTGVSRPMKTGALRQVDSWKTNIIQRPVDEFIVECLEAPSVLAADRANSEWAKAQMQERITDLWRDKRDRESRHTLMTVGFIIACLAHLYSWWR